MIHRFGGEETAIIQVGSTPKLFHVHKSLLCDASPFFRAALNGRFKESAEGVVTLPYDDPEAFERFLGWLYFREYEIKVNLGSDKEFELWQEIVVDHIFADKVQASDFHNHIMEAVVQAFQTLGLRPMPLRSIHQIYSETRETSPLRSLAVAMYERVGASWFQDPKTLRNLEEIPKFTAALAVKLSGSGRSAWTQVNLAAKDFYEQVD
jgi:BTB/POZ domain